MSLDSHKVAASRLWAANKFPYLASGLFACTIVGAEGLGGIAVDEHWRLYVDPKTVDDLSVEQMGSLLVHHVGHLLRDHAGRAAAAGVDSKSADDWARAADAEINDDLSEADLVLPGKVIMPSDLDSENGRMAEEYFRAIRDRTIEINCDCGSGSDHQSRTYELTWGGDTPAIGSNTADLIRCQVASECMRQEGQQPGSIPGGLLRWAEALARPKVNWRRMLAAELRRGVASIAGAVDYSYSKPSRRQSAMSSVIMPAMRRPIPQVAVVIDTSGSMAAQQLSAALAEVEGLLTTIGVGARSLRVLSCDADVHKVQRVSSARKVELVGGGGTDMGRGIAAAVALKPSPSLVVVLTDGFTPWPDTGPKGVKVVVGLIGNGRLFNSAFTSTPAWARVVHIDDVA